MSGSLGGMRMRSLLAAAQRDRRAYRYRASRQADALGMPDSLYRLEAGRRLW
ncbi:MAG TPA: hypothetical protein VIQ31_12360 [Phormidium sp.]